MLRQIQSSSDIAECKVRKGPFDLRAANSIGFLAGILLKGLERGRFEERLDHLEAAMTGKRGMDTVLFEFKSPKGSAV